MRYRLYIFLRLWLTLMCKVAAFAADKTRASAALELLSFFIEKRGGALKREASICMKRTLLWQTRAGKCVAAYHQTEKILKETAEIKQQKDSV